MLYGKCQIILFVIGLIFGTAGAGFAVEEGLVAHFKFDEGSGTTVRDASGHNHDGTIHGAEFVKMQQGFALAFDGKDDYVQVPDSEALRLAETVTFEAWVNVPVNAEQTVLSKNGCDTLRQNYLLKLEENRVRVSLVECPEFGAFHQTAYSAGIQPNRWYHLAGSYDGETIRVYVNGAQTGRLDATFDVGTLEAPLYIGANFYGPKLGGFFSGKIDEVKIYSRALSGEQIAAHYQAEKDVRISKLTRLITHVSEFENKDTTPPVIKLPSPPPDSTANGMTTISVRFGEKGSGIDIASAKIVLDASDVTDRAIVTEDGVSFTPNQPFSDGVHQVQVTVSDKVGNAGNRTAWQFGVNAAVPVRSEFDGDVFRVNGEPFFPLGVYSGNVKPNRPMPYLAQAAEAGINHRLVGGGGTQAKQALDDLLAHGVKGLVHLYYQSLALGNGDPQPLVGLVNKVKDHPANLGWWNEYASVNQAPLVTETYRTVKAHDTNHPVVFMLQWAGKLSDAYFVYAYPILNPLLPDNSIRSQWDGCIKSAIEASREEGKGKHVWFASQAFDYRIGSSRGKTVGLEGGFRPSREELRAINYLALAKGVKGLLLYAPGAEIPGTDFIDDFAIYPRQWTEVLKMASEIRHLTPVLATGVQVKTVKLEQDGDAIHFLELSHEGVHTLIAVNVEPEFHLAKWRFEKAVQPKVLFEDRTLTNRTEGFADLFKPLEVHIYQW